MALVQLWSDTVPVLFLTAPLTIESRFEPVRRRSDLWSEIFIVWDGRLLVMVVFSGLVCYSIPNIGSGLSDAQTS